jgi:hypothetical protein
MTQRALTAGERRLVQSMFGNAIDCAQVRVIRRKWFPFQPRNALMAPTGHIHAHPAGDLWSEDYSAEQISRQAIFLHEMTHVWQTQQRGKYYLPLMRHPFCRYRYGFDPDRAFDDYGLEQQAEIVRHIHLLRGGWQLSNTADLASLESALPFTPQSDA